MNSSRAIQERLERTADLRRKAKQGNRHARRELKTICRKGMLEPGWER